jgi:hypothetical protein
MTPAEHPIPTAEGQEILCPLCEYDLRGQIEPRCPECGYRFNWEELRNPSRRTHPYIFEQHPRRNIWSFWKTVVGGLRPRRFWSTLLPTQPVRLVRLLHYFLIIALLCAPVHLQQIVMQWAGERANIIAQRPAFTSFLKSPSGAATLKRYPGKTVQQVVDIAMPVPTIWDITRWRSRMTAPVLASLATVLLWPWATIATMMIFRISMRRARVRPIHVVRCVIYCADVLLWAHLALAIVMALSIVGLPGGTTNAMSMTIVYATLLAFLYRFTISLRLYMRFRHALATAIATQVIVILLAIDIPIILRSLW